MISMALYTTTAAIRASGAEVEATARRTYHLRSGLLYLHWSATKLTEARSEAWTGTAEQARNCRARFDAAAGCRLRPIKPLPQHEEVE